MLVTTSTTASLGSDALYDCTEANEPHYIAPGTLCSVLNNIDGVDPYIDRGQPVAWDDLDILEVGHGGRRTEEYVAHSSLWAALEPILLIGTDLRHLDATTLTVLSSPAVIAVN